MVAFGRERASAIDSFRVANMQEPVQYNATPTIVIVNTESIRRGLDYEAASQQAALARRRRLASGRRVANLCLFAWLASGAFRVTQPPAGTLFFLCVTMASVVAVTRMASNFSTRARHEYLFAAASFIPFVNLIPMIVLSMRAAKELRAAGFSVGMLDAQERRSV
jgi:hypothetical protein